MNLGSSNVRTLTFCNLVRMNLVTYLSHASSWPGFLYGRFGHFWTVAVAIR